MFVCLNHVRDVRFIRILNRIRIGEKLQSMEICLKVITSLVEFRG